MKDNAVKTSSSKNGPNRPEFRLRIHWHKIIGDSTEFKKVAPDNIRDIIDSKIVSHISSKIFEGKPLAFDEYHVAIALGLLITELPYEEFFMTRWHETKDHMGYGPKCDLCDRAK